MTYDELVAERDAKVITAEQVREFRSGVGVGDPDGQCDCDRLNYCGCSKRHADFVLRGLLAHPGVSSAARAVIEAALE